MQAPTGQALIPVLVPLAELRVVRRAETEAYWRKAYAELRPVRRAETEEILFLSLRLTRLLYTSNPVEYR